MPCSSRSSEVLAGWFDRSLEFGAGDAQLLAIFELEHCLGLTGAIEADDARTRSGCVGPVWLAQLYGVACAEPPRIVPFLFPFELVHGASQPGLQRLDFAGEPDHDGAKFLHSRPSVP
jgi:hypothetical protein